MQIGRATHGRHIFQERTAPSVQLAFIRADHINTE